MKVHCRKMGSSSKAKTKGKFMLLGNPHTQWKHCRKMSSGQTMARGKFMLLGNPHTEEALQENGELCLGKDKRKVSIVRLPMHSGSIAGKWGALSRQRQKESLCCWATHTHSGSIAGK
jgi:hypothetical protein